MNTNALRSSRTTHLLALAATLALGACGDDDVTDGGPGEPDALVVDAGGDVADDDAGSDTGIDVGDLVDAGMDVAFDAGTDAGPPDPCAEENAMRPAVCGDCGEGQELCQGGVWVLQELCLNQGECSPGAVEEMSTPMCGNNARVCSAMCSWGEFGEVTPDGECTPEEERVVTERCGDAEHATDVCSDTCTWNETAACASECGSFDMAGFDEEICIPAGPFIRGRGASQPSGPQAEVMMSAYLIDRYPVTNARYQACIDVSMCTDLELLEGQARLENPAYATVAARGVTWFQAEAFCVWAGKRLPSAAMIEKSDRGPAPRDAFYPWDGPDYDCSVPRTGCPGEPLGSNPDPVGSQPNDRGWYGTEDAMSGGPFWASDWYDRYYYSDPTSLVDPEGPDTGTRRGSRSFTGQLAVYQRGAARPQDTSGGGGGILTGMAFRCARYVEGS